MRFVNYSALFLMLLPAAVAAAAVFAAWRRKKSLKRFALSVTLAKQLKPASPYLRIAKIITLVLGLALLGFSAARPQYGGRIQMLKKRGVDIVVALDFSKSMLAKDIKPDRLERAKVELSDFISRLSGDRIGLVAFAGDTVRFPLTTDYSAATAFWKGLGPYDMPVGGTAIGKAIVAATRMFLGSEKKIMTDKNLRSRAIILITDGEDHEGDPLSAAEEAKKNGIKIFTLGIGTQTPELIPRYLDDGTSMGYQKNDDGEYVMSALTVENEKILQEISSTTDGRYIRADSDFSGMNLILEEVRKLKQTDVRSRQITIYEEVFQWFLLPALFFIVMSFLLPERVRARKKLK